MFRAVPQNLPPSQTPPTEPPQSDTERLVRLGVVGLLALVAAVIVAVVVLRHGHSHPPTGVKSYGPVALSAAKLKVWAGDLNQVIYWVGPRKGDTYEFTRNSSNYVYVRYLPKGVKAGTHEEKELLIATYPVQGALASLKAAPHLGKLLTVKGHKGAVAAIEKGHRTNVRVAWPHVNFEVEVFDPKPSVALAVATSGDLTPVQ